MIDCSQFGRQLCTLGIELAVGVPDSLLKGMINFFYSSNEIQQITAVNECEAAGIAMGSFLASGKPSLLYMQNSGLGKIVNPYTSLLASEIYSIPVILLIGWRGRPGEKDEPQHVMMGRIMTDLLGCLHIPHVILNDAEWQQQISTAYTYTLQHSTPYAIVATKGLFNDFPYETEITPQMHMSRELAINTIVNVLPKNCLYVCTTGKSSRELFEIREEMGQAHGSDIYTVGGMGCATSIAFGVALNQPARQVVCIDGDGAALMQLGAMATIGHYQLDNLFHILIDNACYESTGGQPTTSGTVDFSTIASGCNYSAIESIATEEALIETLPIMKEKKGPKLLIVQCASGARSNLGRPTTTPLQNRTDFINNVMAVQHE